MNRVGAIPPIVLKQTTISQLGRTVETSLIHGLHFSHDCNFRPQAQARIAVILTCQKYHSKLSFQKHNEARNTQHHLSVTSKKTPLAQQPYPPKRS